ncbi:MAG: arylesterase [Alphaproteobacteria bacterium]
MRYAACRGIFNRARAIAVLIVLAAAPAGAAGPVRILVLGDSLAAGYGLPARAAFPARLEARLKAGGFDVVAINAGVSGDTSAGGRARLDWALADRPDIVIVELGANDALRGLDPAMTRSNLDAILARLRGAGVRVLLTGMYAPPNFGRDYEQKFKALYPALAAKHGVAFYPFFLDRVAAIPALNQPDGIHPNERGVGVIVDLIAPYVVRLLKALERAGR